MIWEFGMGLYFFKFGFMTMKDITAFGLPKTLQAGCTSVTPTTGRMGNQKKSVS